MELASDASVLKKLTPEGRRDYARLLLTLGAGRQLWDVPLSFGECEAKARIQAAVRWRAWSWWRWVATWAAAEVTQVWEMPLEEFHQGFWVRVGQEQWYRVACGWWGDADAVGVHAVEETPPPDLTGQRPVYQRVEGRP